MKKILILSLSAFALSASAPGAIVFFDLIGTAGPGLLPGNETPGIGVGGTGGEIGAGIFYDDVANLLTLNVGWGSSQGFVDLTSTASASHLHGPTAAVNGNDGIGDFRQTAGVLFNLTRSNSASTGGTFTNAPLSLTATQETQLLDGKFYINIHTSNNPGGELRGFLVQAVPEPGAASLLALGALALVRRRR